MSITIKQTKDLVTPEEFRLKVLVYADPGFGKTSFFQTAPKPIYAACETGHMNGLLSIAMSNPSYIEPETYTEFEQFCSGSIPSQAEHETYVVDSLSEMNSRFIKDYAIAQVQRKQGDTDKRRLGVPELDDYQTMAELTRRLLAKILSQPKHIGVTARCRYYQPAVMDPRNPANNKAEKVGGPELPGAMSSAATAMFDLVLRGVKVSALRNPNDAKSRYEKRIWQTETTDKYIAKSRISLPNANLAIANIYPSEVEYNPDTGTGTFKWFYDKALEAYTKAYALLKEAK